MIDVTCQCGRAFPSVRAFPVYCRCGHTVHAQPGYPGYPGYPAAPQPRPRRHSLSQAAQRARQGIGTCRQNLCGHWGTHTCGDGHEREGCGLLEYYTNKMPCRTFEHIYQGGGCLADQPLFPPAPSRMVSTPLPVDTPPPATSSRCVIVVAANAEAQAQYALTGPAIRAYAARVGADFRVLEDDACPEWPMANKWRIAPYVAAYQQTLYLDVDIIIRPGAPDIFAAVPPGRVALYDEGWDSRSAWDWVQAERDRLSIALGRPKTRWTWSANGGVMLLPQWAAGLYQPPPLPYERLWTLDQTLLTMELDRYGIKPYLLAQQWNHGFIADNFWEDAGRAYFVHLNGSRPHGYRMEVLRDAVEDRWPRRVPPDTGWLPRWAQG